MILSYQSQTEKLFEKLEPHCRLGNTGTFFFSGYQTNSHITLTTTTSVLRGGKKTDKANLT